jgi:1-acyl-sn-glycerol-3-phosphate acyltransferase
VRRLLALRSGAPIVPVALWGTEQVHPYSIFTRPNVTIRYGRTRTVLRSDASIETLSKGLMREIADMLPPCYRGIYLGTQGEDDQRNSAG